MTDSWDQIARADATYRFLEAGARSLPRDREQAGGAGLLAGQIIGVKSNIAVAGQAWTAGIAARRDRLAPQDAPVVAQLRAAGAQILSRLIMDEAALGAASDNPYFGRVENPAQPGQSAGGSSGGSAAAVASGALRLALGSDTLGSVRIPAAYCGIVGLKPAPGAMPLDGVLPLAPGFDALGLLGATLPEVSALYALFDQTPAKGGLRVMIPDQLAGIPCAPGALSAVTRVAAAADRLGLRAHAGLVRGWQPEETRRAAFSELCARASETLAAEPGLSQSVRRSLDFGAQLPPDQRAAGARHLTDLRDGLGACFDAGLVLLTPTTPSGSFPHGTRPPRDQASFTALANIAGGASLSVPLPDDRLSSVMLTGAAGTETALLALARDLMDALMAPETSP
ncbi:amidase family protein [Dinoroseobacter sp. S375]|uniref:amidase family protein n=1 Tax=Dinoroseobacter sp. S375 TaxID=3415136 RepID=UPI003C7C2A89